MRQQQPIKRIRPIIRRLFIFFQQHQFLFHLICVTVGLVAFYGGTFNDTMNGGLAFKPFRLLSKEILTEGFKGLSRVLKLVIALNDEKETLGFGQ